MKFRVKEVKSSSGSHFYPQVRKFIFWLYFREAGDELLTHPTYRFSYKGAAEFIEQYIIQTQTKTKIGTVTYHTYPHDYER